MSKDVQTIEIKFPKWVNLVFILLGLASIMVLIVGFLILLIVLASFLLPGWD